jgi:hypothetical protein
MSTRTLGSKFFLQLLLVLTLVFTHQVQANTKTLQDHATDIKDLIIGLNSTSFVGPSSTAIDIRRATLIEILDGIHAMIKWNDDQSAIDELRMLTDVTDGIAEPNSNEDWIIGVDAQLVFDEVNALITEIDAECESCL